MTTLKKSVTFSGRGIHSGLPVNMVVRPSNKGGIFFVRTDISPRTEIPAKFDNVGDTKLRNTTVGDLNGAHVKTIEHLMAALFMCGIDSAIIEIDGPETPILDGSAHAFLTALSGAAKSGELTKIIVKKPVVAYAREIRKTLPFFVRAKLWVMDKITGKKNDGFVALTPNTEQKLNIKATLVYKEKIIGAQTYSYTYDGSKKSRDKFSDEISRARTFGKYSEWEFLKSHSMARGADETNVIALNDSGDGTLNKLIWHDEFVRHKIIDAIGDMFTSGGVIIGNLESYKGSHALNNIVLKKLFSVDTNYDIIKPNGKKK